MNRVKILHCADLHIGAAESTLGTLASGRRFEALLTFEKITDAARENGVGLLIISGDLLDSNRIESQLVDGVFRAIESIPEIRVVFAAGNHDPLTAESPFVTRTLPENLTVLGTRDECVFFEELGVRIYGRSFSSSSMNGEEMPAIHPEDDGVINIMAVHGELRSDLSSQYNPITPRFVKLSGMDYIALGHVHTRTEAGRIGNTFFAYPGCPEGQGFDETDEKGVYIGEIAKGECSLSFVPMSRRKHIAEETDISSCEDTSSAAELIMNTLSSKYGDGFRDNLYKITLTGQLAPELIISLPELTSRLSAGLYYCKVKDKTTLRVDLQALAAEPSLKGIFVKNMLEKLENAGDSEKTILSSALELGLRAFSSEVGFNED